MLAEEWPEGAGSAPNPGYTRPWAWSFASTMWTPLRRTPSMPDWPTRPIKDQFYGHRDVLFVDPFGYPWSVSTVKEEMSVEEMHRRMKSRDRTGGGELPPQKRKEAGGPSDPARLPHPPALHDRARSARATAVRQAGVRCRGNLPGHRLGRWHPRRSSHRRHHANDGRRHSRARFRATQNTQALHMYVHDTDAVYKKALAAGATLIGEPQDQEYGERRAA